MIFLVGAGRNIANNQFTGWIPVEFEAIDKIEWVFGWTKAWLRVKFPFGFLTWQYYFSRTGGNTWSSGPAPPPPPGQRSSPRAHKHSEKDADKSGLGGVAIAGIILGVLVALGMIIALISRRSSSPPSHFLEEDKHSQCRPFTPLASQELSNDMRAEMHSNFRGNLLSPSPNTATPLMIPSLNVNTSVSKINK